MAQKKEKLKGKAPDFLLAASAIIILGFGLVMVLSAGARFSYQIQDNTYYLFGLQARWALLGLGAALVATLVPYGKWRRLSGVAVLLALILLVLVDFTPLGSTQGKGAARWLEIGGFSLQVSEVAKPALILFLAHNFDQYPVRKLKDALVSGGIALLLVGLVGKEDLGTAVVMLGTVAAMFLQTGFPLRYFLIGAPLAAAGGFLMILRNTYQKNRIIGWLNPWAHLDGSGYQTAWAEFALASGGVFGAGIGNNIESTVLPENYNDMIFSVIGQELGFFGACIFILIFALLIIRCYYVSYRCREHFGRLLGFGLTTGMAIQAGVNLAVVAGLFPVTGITLPLVSHGGTSLFFTLFEIGVLLNISRYPKVAV